MQASGSRATHASAVLGPELAARLPELRVLLVGAGGIGCELREFPRRKVLMVYTKALLHSQELGLDWLRSNHPVGLGYNRPLKPEQTVPVQKEGCEEL
jgi:hypothetical protein